MYSQKKPAVNSYTGKTIFVACPRGWWDQGKGKNNNLFSERLSRENLQTVPEPLEEIEDGFRT